MDNKLYFAKVKEGAIIPTKKDEDAGYDFYCCSDEDIIIEPHTTVLVPTGVACAMSKDYYMQLFERGSTGSKGIKTSCGVIDSSFRGEIFVAMYNSNPYTLTITDKVTSVEKHDPILPEVFAMLITQEDELKYGLYYPKSKAICQGVVLPVPKMEVEEISYDELLKFDSDRGTGMLGESGK